MLAAWLHFLDDPGRCFSLHSMAKDYGKAPSDFLRMDILSFSFNLKCWSSARQYEAEAMKEGGKPLNKKKVKENVIFVERERSEALGW